MSYSYRLSRQKVDIRRNHDVMNREAGIQFGLFRLECLAGLAGSAGVQSSGIHEEGDGRLGIENILSKEHS